MAVNIALQQLRRQAVLAAFPTPAPLGRVFEQLGFVQADPIQAPARAQDLILRHRTTAYRAGDLDRRFARLGLEEAYLYAYGFMTPDLQALLLPRYDLSGVEGRHVPGGLEADVLKFVRGHGPTHPSALAEQFGRNREINAWGGMSKATTRALQILQHHGLLRVARRDGGIRVYETLTERDEVLSPAERVERLTLVVARILAPVPIRSLVRTMGPIVRSVLGPSGRFDAMPALLKSGAMLEGVVDGLRYVWPAEFEVACRARNVVRFLAPFDPLVWDRRRFEHLYGWAYRFEAYTPETKRRLGYYAMPLLWVDTVIGWVNVARRGKRLEIYAGFVEGRPRTRAFAVAFDEEVARMEQFMLSPSEGYNLARVQGEY